VIAHLLVNPPERGELQSRLRALAEAEYRHPQTGAPVRFDFSTIERWYYLALRAEQPSQSLRRKQRHDAGQTRVWTLEWIAALEEQYRRYPGWNVVLHRDNLCALARAHPEWGALPSYSSVRRMMKRRGWVRSLKKKSAQDRVKNFEHREVRGFEHEYVHALWHLDFHKPKGFKIATSSGEWFEPKVLCILDDASRLCCHIQWYREEETESLVHGLIQALLKRGLCRALMSDNGGAMIAAETVEGLERLSILHETTLPYSPHQNAKQEHFWTRVDGRFLPLLEGLEITSLTELNHMCLAWIEQDYHVQRHEELGCSPLEKLKMARSVARPAPKIQDLREAFAQQTTRVVRHSDGTIQVQSTRFEVPAHLRHLPKLVVRYRRWDLSRVYVVDNATQKVIATLRPLDRKKNASGARRVLEPQPPTPLSIDGPPALLRQWLGEYAASGLPPAFLPWELQGGEKNEL
jgi:transposase InsO family protein